MIADFQVCRAVAGTRMEVITIWGWAQTGGAQHRMVQRRGIDTLIFFLKSIVGPGIKMEAFQSAASKTRNNLLS